MVDKPKLLLKNINMIFLVLPCSTFAFTTLPYVLYIQYNNPKCLSFFYFQVSKNNNNKDNAHKQKYLCMCSGNCVYKYI